MGKIGSDFHAIAVTSSFASQNSASSTCLLERGHVGLARLDTTTPAGKAMFQMMGVVAEFERAMSQERVRAGLARARSEDAAPSVPTRRSSRC
jgi:DNA invertase Pin-like site-specific DNA recombinase